MRPTCSRWGPAPKGVKRVHTGPSRGNATRSPSTRAHRRPQGAIRVHRDDPSWRWSHGSQWPRMEIGSWPHGSHRGRMFGSRIRTPNSIYKHARLPPMGGSLRRHISARPQVAPVPTSAPTGSVVSQGLAHVAGPFCHRFCHRGCRKPCRTRAQHRPRKPLEASPWRPRTNP